MPETLPQSEIRAGLLKYAVFCLNRRPYFRETLRQKLVLRTQKMKYGNQPEVISKILDDLQKSGYLNDAYLAGAYVRRHLEKGYGPRIISFKLSRLHLDKDTIEIALSEEADTDRQFASIQKYAANHHKLDKRKLVSKLYLRGFSSLAINRLFDSEYIEE